MVDDWIHKKNLAKLGYTFDGSDLTDFEVAAYGLITQKMGELEAAELEKKSKVK